MRRAVWSAAVAASLAAAVFLALRLDVGRALETRSHDGRPLQFVALPAPEAALETWGSGDVDAIAITPDAIVTAGGAGVLRGDTPLPGLPTRRATAVASWRGEIVTALAAGGWFRRAGDHWEEARSGYGRLEVRTLVETPAGELLIGARQGLFRIAWGSPRLERLATVPVRTIALLPGALLAGGEDGLVRIEASRVLTVQTPDPWIETVAISGDETVMLTASGLARGPLGAIRPVSGALEAASLALHEGAAYTIDGRSPVVRRLADGRTHEELLPSTPRRLLTAGGTLFADSEAGLFTRSARGWELLRARDRSLPGSAHVGALAWFRSHVVAGLFDGGLLTFGENGAWRQVPGSSAWGVNALLPAGGALYVASLRGAARLEGETLRPIEGPGAAFSLATTRDGVAIGYGKGVLLPGTHLLSAFHGLPGNQALALAAGPELFVGTPSGLGAISGSRVRWRVTAGEGKLPNPWVTALAFSGDALYVGTYGGGLVRRSVRAGKPSFAPFVETEGMKVNTGCLVEAGGRVWAGTDGGGLLRLSADRARFVPVAVVLPSPHVTALLPTPGALYIGTDEGIARLPLTTTEVASE
jgi:hypothetical protein